MRVAVKCESPLLQRSVELFLDKELSPIKNCDIVVSDQKLDIDKKILYISNESDGDLLKPFSKSQLVLALEKVMNDEKESKSFLSMIEELEQKESFETTDKGLDFKFLQDRIEQLTQEYQENLIKTIRAFYEK
jgi:DnaJ-domain-containing protein 1